MRFPAAVALVALGGAAGSYARVAASMVVPSALAATLAVNLLGAFALGFLVTRLSGGGRRQQMARLLLGTGFCGGFTTYSLIALQAATLLQQGDALRAVLYCAATLVCGALATLLGVVVASWRRADRAPAVS